MALTPERIMELSDRLLRVVGAGYVRPQDADGFARAIEAEVRRQNTELIASGWTPPVDQTLIKENTP